MSNNQDTKHNIYWISKDGLKNLQNNHKRGVAINIWNSNAKPGTDMWVIADGDNRAPFTKPSLDADADFVFIVDDKVAYFYTWDKGKSQATSLRLVASFQIKNSNLFLKKTPKKWTIMKPEEVVGLLNDYYGNINKTSWIKIQCATPTALGTEFINKAIYYNVLDKYSILQNENIQIVPGKSWGTLKLDDGPFSINGQSYKFDNSTGNGDLWHFIEHINNGYGNYFYANLSYEGNCIKYNLYLKPMLHTIQFKKELEKSHNIILNGAPGTGKTYLAHEIAAVMLGKNTWKEVENDANLSSHVGFVQFHPSYDYTDFVEGLRPTTQGNQPFELLPGIFKTFCEEALKNGYKNDGKGKYETKDGNLVAKEGELYIFIIDEINRGEMSKIFGELFFSIDPGYRGKKGKVLTQYANMEKNGNEFDKALNNGKKGQFFVPENVYIIGTMNDIDRSVESMDFAMRRRFKFIEILASKQDSMLRTTFGNDADAVIRRMNNLNLAIQETEGLGSEYHIGPSYFLKLERPNGVCDFSRLWNDYLEGIIFEYLRGREDTNEALDRIKKVYLTEKTAFFDLEPKSGKLSVTNSNDWSKVFNND